MKPLELPAPEICWREVDVVEAVPSARSGIRIAAKKAERNGWTLQAYHARGPHVTPSWSNFVIADSIALAMRRDEVSALARWVTDPEGSYGFEFAMQVLPHVVILDSNGLRALLDSPAPEVEGSPS